MVGFFLLTPQVARILLSPERIHKLQQELAYFSLLTAEWLVSRGPFLYGERPTGESAEATIRVTQLLGERGGRGRAIVLLLPRYALLLVVALPIVCALVTTLPLWAGLALAYGIWLLATLRWFIEDTRESTRNLPRIQTAIAFLLAYLLSPPIFFLLLAYWVAVVTVSVILASLANYLGVPDALRKWLNAAGIAAEGIGLGLELASIFLNI